MSRELGKREIKEYITNRTELHKHLSELQADFEDLNDDELIFCREVMLKRINMCLELILETEEDNLK